MGSPFKLIFYTTDSARALQAAKASFQLVDSLNAIFSDYLDSSELNRLSRSAGSGRPIPVSMPLYEVLLTSQQAAKKSRNAFDITIGALSKRWRQARREQLFPDEKEVTAALKKKGMEHLVIDTAAKTVRLLQEGLQLDLGGIAKGYVAQAVVNYLTSIGVTAALADAGGDIACSQPPPGKEGWTVGINRPQSATALLAETVVITNCAVATSGDLYQFIEHRGKRYSHIIDPRTGYGVPFQRNVTIIAPDGATADWLATACSILPLKACRRLAKQLRAELLITQVRKNKLQFFMTPGMKGRLRS
jgi:thiamine biosynthesis lipoprotein